MCEKKCRVSVRLETQPTLAGGFEIRANTSCCRGTWIPLPSGSGGAFLPLAGGVMNNGANIRIPDLIGGYIEVGNATLVFNAGGTNSTITSNGYDAALSIAKGNGYIVVNGGVQVVTADADYPIAHVAVLVDASAGNVTINLPASVNDFQVGSLYRIKKIDASANVVNVLAHNGSATIDDVPTQTISTQYTSLTIVRNGFGVSTKYYIV